MPVRPAIIPCLRYRDAPAAIDFLCSAFGFERHTVYPDEADPTIILHAQLLLDGNMIMLGSDRNDETKRFYNWKTPREAGITMSICVVVDDPDTHAARAAMAGARILHEPYDNAGYPGRAYDVADPEGNIWNFGSYDPFAAD